MFRNQKISRRRHILTAGIAALAAVLVVGTFPADAANRGFGGSKSVRSSGFGGFAVGPRAVYRSGSVNTRFNKGFRGHGRLNAGWKGNYRYGNRGFGGRGGKWAGRGIAGPRSVSGRQTYSYLRPYGYGGISSYGYRGFGPYGYGYRGYGIGRVGINPLGYAQPYSYSYGGFNRHYGYPYGRFNTFRGVPVPGIWSYGANFAPFGGAAAYGGGAQIIAVGAGGSAAQTGGEGQGMQDEEICKAGEFCVVRLGSGYSAPKIITLNKGNNNLTPEPVN
jgi:hypothetical protein